MRWIRAAGVAAVAVATVVVVACGGASSSALAAGVPRLALDGDRFVVLDPYRYDSRRPYAAGQNRGVDVIAVGGSVEAPVAGTVRFAGLVAGRGVVTLDAIVSGQPVVVTITGLERIDVDAGERVAAGAVVGRAVRVHVGAYDPARRDRYFPVRVRERAAAGDGGGAASAGVATGEPTSSAIVSTLARLVAGDDVAHRAAAVPNVRELPPEPGELAVDPPTPQLPVLVAHELTARSGRLELADPRRRPAAGAPSTRRTGGSSIPARTSSTHARPRYVPATDRSARGDRRARVSAGARIAAPEPSVTVTPSVLDHAVVFGDGRLSEASPAGVPRGSGPPSDATMRRKAVGSAVGETASSTQQGREVGPAHRPPGLAATGWIAALAVGAIAATAARHLHAKRRRRRRRALVPTTIHQPPAVTVPRIRRSPAVVRSGAGAWSALESGTTTDTARSGARSATRPTQHSRA